MTAHDDRIRLLQLQLNDTAKQLAALQRLDRLGSTDVGGTLHAATAKTTPVDADTMPLIDSAASNALKKVTWANIKATLKTYFDTLYAAIPITGTWPPTLAPSSGSISVSSYPIQNGRYTRIGDVVHFSFFIRTSGYSAGTGTGEIFVLLPHTVSSTTLSLLAFSVASNGVTWPGTPVGIAAEVVAGTNGVRFYASQAAGLRQYVAPSALSAATDIGVSGFYFV